MAVVWPACLAGWLAESLRLCVDRWTSCRTATIVLREWRMDFFLGRNEGDTAQKWCDDVTAGGKWGLDLVSKIAGVALGTYQ